jgi:hypothetical protein
MRTKNSAIPCRVACPIQVIPSPSSAKNLYPGTPNGIPVYIYILRMEESGRFHHAALVRIRQPDRNGGAALQVAHELEPPLRRGYMSQKLF